MWILIIKSFYLVLPAYLANMAPVVFAKLGLLKFANQPIDGSRKIKGEYIFGLGKTWRGIIAAVILGVVVTSVQTGLYQYEMFRNISLFNYEKYYLWFGILAGLGAILGDLVKSFIKRRVGIKSGKSWPIFDQLDFIVGFFIFTYFIARPSMLVIIAVMVLTLILHPLINIMAYWLKIKKVWW